MKRSRLFVFKLFIAVIVGGGAILLTSPWWLPLVGWALVHDDGPTKADLAVVLGGDPWGNRIRKAGDLVREGYVPAALVSGPPGYYDEHESEPEIAYAVRHGYSPQYFISFPVEARSTVEEAADLLPELQRRHCRRVLLVTNDYHTRRALRIFREVERKMDCPIELRVIATPDKEFHPASWWRTRQGRKITLIEWTKTFAAAIGL